MRTPNKVTALEEQGRMPEADVCFHPRLHMCAHVNMQPSHICTHERKKNRGHHCHLTDGRTEARRDWSTFLQPNSQ